MSVRTYAPEDVVAQWGPVKLREYADGTFIKVERLTPERFKTLVGAQGEVSRTKVADNAARVTVTLKQTSGANKELQPLAKIGTPFPFGITNRGGTQKEVAGSPESWIEKDAQIEYSKDETNREYSFICVAWDSTDLSE